MIDHLLRVKIYDDNLDADPFSERVRYVTTLRYNTLAPYLPDVIEDIKTNLNAVQHTARIRWQAVPKNGTTGRLWQTELIIARELMDDEQPGFIDTMLRKAYEQLKKAATESRPE